MRNDSFFYFNTTANASEMRLYSFLILFSVYPSLSFSYSPLFPLFLLIILDFFVFPSPLLPYLSLQPLPNAHVFRTAQRLMQERSRSHHRTEWLSTPNAYHKVEVEETGTPNPRKFTRWVADKEGEKPNSGTATPVRSANQFAPQVSGSPLLISVIIF